MSSYNSNNEVRRQSSKAGQPLQTNKSLYAEQNKANTEKQEDNQFLENKQPEEIFHVEYTTGRKQAPACCTTSTCNIF